MLVAEAPMTALRAEGLNPTGLVRRNLAPAELYEETLRLRTGRLAHGGGLVTLTAPHTGRSPNDRFVVYESGSSSLVDWGDINVPISEEHYALLKTGIIDLLNGTGRLYVRDAKGRRRSPVRHQGPRDLREPVARPLRP